MTPNDQPLFRALSDPTRRAILKQLSERDMTIVEVTQNFDMTRAAIKKHLSILTDGGLVTVHPRGREKVNSINPMGLSPLRDWLSFFDQFWDERLDELKSAIEKDIPND